MSVDSPHRDGALRWFDQHCHLPRGDAAQPVLESARAAGVDRMLTVGTSLERSRQCVEQAEQHDGVWATAGVHPHDAVDGVAGIDELLDHPAVLAVGEAGLDYHYDNSPRAVQADVFAAHIALANTHDLPLVIHTREAWDDTFTILDREGVPARTVFHCFTGGPDEATGALDRGAMLSISGIVTFPNAGDLQAAVAATPLERLMVETDSPYLTPVPHRGTQNEPAFVVHVGAKVAELTGATLEQVAEQTTAAACRFYAVD